MKKIPNFLKKYFWDVEPDKIDLNKHRTYILKKILEYGDTKAVNWMMRHYKKSEIRYVLSGFRGYTKKSANYWAVILDIPKKEVLCLKKRSSKTPRIFWPY